MTLLSQLTSLTISSYILEQAKGYLLELITPKRIVSDIIEYYVRRALRLGIWRKLKPEAKALLQVLRKWSKPIKSPLLLTIVKHILLEIEIHTFKGKALLMGLILVLQKSKLYTFKLLQDIKKILLLGISYLNNPLMYRFHMS